MKIRRRYFLYSTIFFLLPFIGMIFYFHFLKSNCDFFIITKNLANKFSDISIALTNDYINTGSNLLAKINKFNFKEINIYDIIYHYGAASQYCRLDKNQSNYIYHMEYIHENVRKMTIDDFLKLM